ncbi:MAG: AAA family ATPase [Deltaproteobacteria bacterium]|nr:AAA family ATPase [Deltaproteobacteria bacterium]
MITKLTLRNFKSINEQSYEFTKFDLLVGRNNCGKSTILQALAIWQFCLDEFHRSNRSGSKGIQVILPNFTALPLPEFNLLWRNRTDREWPPDEKGVKRQKYILIEIHVDWQGIDGKSDTFGVQLRYSSPQTIYAIPTEGWEKFRDLEKKGSLPIIAYVPPFSGLEPSEEWRDDGPLRKQVGKAQPGSVLRNLLLRVAQKDVADPSTPTKKTYKAPPDWNEIKEMILKWFSVKLREPKYIRGVDTQITCEYIQNDKAYDLIAGGSGFHQTLTLLAFLYGYCPTTILLDEPDAHLHVNLQREILDYFKRKSNERNVQFLIGTHAEEFVRGVDVSQLISMLGQIPKRVESTPQVLQAMAEVSNAELAQLWSSPVILYVEGESDERILRGWAKTCGAEEAFDKVCFRSMGGGSKSQMKDNADRHFNALRQIIPKVQRIMLFDYDDSESAFHPDTDNLALYEWKRKNIENYLLVPDAWIRATAKQLGIENDDLFVQPFIDRIRDFFSSENLTLPEGKSWGNLKANIFMVVDGKKILFENKDALFQQLRKENPSVELIREAVATNMNFNEIHEDVKVFFERLKKVVEEIS